jgi:hypothetical protein
MKGLVKCMQTEKLYNASQVCERLGITIYTLTNWYNWEKKGLRDGLVKEPYLPEPLRMTNVKGKPRMWTETMVEGLTEYQKGIVTGRNGSYGIYSNPYYKETKKYKKSLETVDKE